MIVDGHAVFFSVPTLRFGLQSEFSVEGITELPRVEIVYSYANFGRDTIDYLVSQGVKGIVLAGVGDGNTTDEALVGLQDAANKGVVRWKPANCCCQKGYLRTKTTRPEIGCSKLLHKLLHTRFPERPKMHQNGSGSLTVHNNIRKVGSFRNRQVIGSSPIVGSMFSYAYQHSFQTSGSILGSTTQNQRWWLARHRAAKLRYAATDY